MFKSVLVANRGEIACRVFRTARAMGMRTIAVFSDADASAKHVREADAAIHIGPAPAPESYLRGEKIIEAARATGAEAIHPGYGLLSENPDFAEAVIAAGLIWIGPTPAAIRAMGLKDEAKRIAEEAGVPVVPGYRGADQDVKTLKAAAREIGYPALIKAVAGGGGRGIREVQSASDFTEALASAKREALAAFGDERVIVEKLIERPRHIEVQVFGDKHGGLVHLFERDCSLQRRRQKVIEEAPAPGMSEEVRAAMTAAALKVARAVSYENAGTVEFIVDGSGPLRPDGFWFLEMNTRLQVEHPVTEAVTGLDLVEWQFRVAAGEKLPLAQDDIKLTGHAIEARICAEDPSEGFRPSVGRLTTFEAGMRSHRWDAGFDEGDAVSTSYDSLLAKLIVSQTTRRGACNHLAFALSEIKAAGVRTNAAFLRKCLLWQDMLSGRVHTGLIADAFETLTDRSHARTTAAACIALAQVHFDRFTVHSDPWDAPDGFRVGRAPRASWALEDELGQIVIDVRQLSADCYVVDVSGRRLEFRNIAGTRDRAGGRLSGYEDGEYWQATLANSSEAVTVFVDGDAFAFQFPGASREHADGAASDEVRAPLPGKIVALAARPGQDVKKGDALVTLEAMKMEHALKAPRDGVIAYIAVEAGAQVKEGAVLVRLEALEA